MGMLKEIAARLVTRTVDGVLETRYRLAHLWALASAPQEQPRRPADAVDLVNAIEEFVAAHEAVERTWPPDPERDRASVAGGEEWSALSEEERKAHPRASMDMPSYLAEVRRRIARVDAARRRLHQLLAS